MEEAEREKRKRKELMEECKTSFELGNE